MPPTARAPDRSSLLLGVDTGGSHTRVAIAREDLAVLARAEGPGAAMRPGGARASAAVVAETARRAAAQAGVALPADAGAVGAAGAGRFPEGDELAAALVEAGVARQVRVLGDAEVGLFAAFGSGPGVLLIAGTGSIAFARDPQGALQRRGGYGWQLGDEGGGYWLGRRALAAAGRAHDGREEGTTLLGRLLGALGLRDFNDLVRWAATATPTQIAGLAPQVLNAARDGEAVALRLVEEAAQELAELVGSLERHFPEPDPLPVATAGGLLRADSPLYRAVQRALRATVPRARLETGAVDATLGALRLARELVGG